MDIVTEKNLSLLIILDRNNDGGAEKVFEYINMKCFYMKKFTLVILRALISSEKAGKTENSPFFDKAFRFAVFDRFFSEVPQRS